jgi:hypothetical protein
MEEQGSAGGAERQIAKLVEDDEIGVGESRRDLAGFALKLLLFESVDEFDGGEEADALTMMFDGCPSSDDLRHIAGFRKGGSGSSVNRIMRHAVDAASGGLRLSGA